MRCMGILNDEIITRIALETAGIVVVNRSVITAILNPGRVVRLRSARNAERVPECHLIEPRVAGSAHVRRKV